MMTSFSTMTSAVGSNSTVVISSSLSRVNPLERSAVARITVANFLYFVMMGVPFVSSVGFAVTLGYYIFCGIAITIVDKDVLFHVFLLCKM